MATHLQPNLPGSRARYLGRVEPLPDLFPFLCSPLTDDPAALRSELTEAWAVRTDPGHLARYQARCPVAGTEPADYRLQRLSLPDGDEVLAGIHFKRLDVDWPFVGVLAWSAPDPRRASGLARALGAVFAPFRPRAVQLFLPGETAPAGEATLDQRLVVGRIAALREGPRPAGFERLSLRAGNDAEDLAAWVAERYAALHVARPELRERVTPADADELRECQAAGGLWEAWRGERRVGLFAARPGSRLGHRGAEVVEELLDPACWGQGLGPVLQRGALERLPAGWGPWMWGTIDERNRASLATALRVGRRVAGAWWFVPCAAGGAQP